jgi:hypothetical protein
MDRNEIVYEGVDWIYVAEDRHVADSCEHDNEPSSSIRGKAFTYQLSDHQLLKGSALCL